MSVERISVGITTRTKEDQPVVDMARAKQIAVELVLRKILKLSNCPLFCSKQVNLEERSLGADC